MKGKKILFVEDDELMSRMYRRIFVAQGCVVEVAQNGLEGYVKATVFQPDLIFLDVMMPKMNGLELFEKMKADKDMKDIPIIMLTNLASQTATESTLLKGAAGYLIKSDHDPEDLVAFAKKFFGE
ncbi:MAG TPA: response regulator [Patescibacteria group bacterium]|nr:response regulator [Patescibacteria group bacterium]